MAPPQQPELRRSGRTPLDPDHMETAIEGEPHAPSGEPGAAPVPADNQPGHHPDHEQDKPDLDAFAEKMGTKPHESDETSGDGGEDADGPADRSATDSGPDVTSTSADEGGRSVARTALKVASTAAGLAEKVATPAIGALRSAVSRLRHDDSEGSSGSSESSTSTADADRIARLESRVADLERRIERDS